MTELPLDGERVIEASYQNDPGMYAIFLMHTASYRFAQAHAGGKRVLDLGCGSGYGAAMMAEVAADVVAVDVSADAIAYASAHHHRPNVTHLVIQAGARLPFADESFDVVLSFQVIEHVGDDAGYVDEAFRVLAKGGTLIVITPNRAVRLFNHQKPWNRWHLREYSASTLAALFDTDRFDLDMRFMTADGPISELELRRYRRVKWATLPFTLPFFPESFRVGGLNLLHKFASPPTGSRQAQSLDEGDVRIGEASGNALNLVAVARKRVCA
jgi:SAM-dependent methyltransferase